MKKRSLTDEIVSLVNIFILFKFVISLLIYVKYLIPNIGFWTLVIVGVVALPIASYFVLYCVTPFTNIWIPRIISKIEIWRKKK